MDPVDLTDLTGLTKTVSYTVRAKDSARAYGSGTVDVLSTPALVAFMENAALQLLEPYLPENQTSVGSFIALHHVGAAKIGDRFSCTAKITGVEGRKVLFSIIAITSEKELGRAEHTRFLVDRQKFMSKLNSTGVS